MNSMERFDTPLSSDERQMVEAIEQLASTRIAPRAAEIDRANEYPWDIKELLAEQGILMMPFPVEYGGVGASELALACAVEVIARVSVTASLILAMQQLGALPILLGGSEEQKRRYLPPLASGKWLVAYGLTEPGAGSDIAAIRTRAERKGDHYVLSGSKQFITNAGLAHVNIIFAKTDPARGADCRASAGAALLAGQHGIAWRRLGGDGKT